MRKDNSLIGAVLFFVLGIYSLCFAQATTEELTITTYYPSPVGQYAELTSQGGTATWTTTAGWNKALIIGGTGGQSIQFTNSGEGVQHFGLGARNSNDFYGWYTNTLTSAGDIAHYWLQVDASATPPNITLTGNVTVAGNLTVSGTVNTCVNRTFSEGSGTTGCPAGYKLPMGPFVATWDLLSQSTSGEFLCCKYQ